MARERAIPDAGAGAVARSGYPHGGDSGVHPDEPDRSRPRPLGLISNLNPFGKALSKFIDNQPKPDEPKLHAPSGLMLTDEQIALWEKSPTAVMREQAKHIGAGMGVVAATMQGRTFGRADRVYRREYRFDGRTRYRKSLIHLADHHVGGSRIYCDVGGCKKSYPKANLRAWRHHFWRDHTV